MAQYSPLGCFVKEWTCYLEMHGHRVTQHRHDANVLLSHDRKGRRYRWVLRCEEGDSLLLAASDRRSLRSHARRARRAGEECFLVVNFGHPAGKAVVLPAREAGRLRRLHPDKAGIPWEC